jgi:hypothetical protein
LDTERSRLSERAWDDPWESGFGGGFGSIRRPMDIRWIVLYRKSALSTVSSVSQNSRALGRLFRFSA